MPSKRTAVLTVIGTLILLFVVFDLQQYLTLDFFRQQKIVLEAYHQENPLLTALGYFTLYVLVTGISLPGAAVLTLAGGAIFGLWHGLLLVSFASTLGATIAFLVSRLILRDWVQTRFGRNLKTFNEGVRKEGAFYLFTLRLVPIFPFFVINLVMGLTPLRTSLFFIVSQVGMLPGTLVFVNAGTQLAQVDSMKGILSPELLLSFALLGVFPLLAKRIISWARARRVPPK